MAKAAGPKAKVRSAKSYQGVDTRQMFTTFPKFLGYRNREDKTILPFGWMIEGSQNVLIDISGRLKNRKGMTLDGQSSPALDTTSKGSFDWLEHKLSPIYLRYNGGRLQFRYVNSSGTVLWTNVITGLVASNKIRFCNFWDNTELLNVCLFSNGTNNVYEWNGATATYASSTANSIITLQGNNSAMIGYTNPTGTVAVTAVSNGVGTGMTGQFDFASQPNNNDTLILSINGTPITITFVSAIGATPGNVLIGATKSDTIANLKGLLSSSGTTSATQVALSAPNQALVGYITYNGSYNNSLTIQGTSTISNIGFYATANKSFTLGGTAYTYAGISTYGGLSLLGVSPDPTIGGQSVGDLLYQNVVSTSTSLITSFPANMVIDGIANKDNQIYFGSHSSNNIIISKVNNYKDVSYSGNRLVGEGSASTLRSPWRSFRVQESDMYASSGKSQWSLTSQVLSSDNTHEALGFKPLKASDNLGALSQECVNSDRNSVVYISNEPRLLTLGRTQDILGTPMTTEYSYPIVNDMNNIDTTDACVFYSKSYVYMSFPKSGKWFILNQTDSTNVFWEAPQTGNIASFSNINGYLYAHDYYTAQTFKLFDGYVDNGNPIKSVAQFSYHDFGNKGLSKYFNEFWVEGYISVSTILELDYLYELDGCQTQVTKLIKGNSSNVCSLVKDGILGGKELGVTPLGANSIASTTSDPLPPYFSLIKASNRKDFYKMSIIFQSYQLNAHWELLSFGPMVQDTMFGNNQLKED